MLPSFEYGTAVRVVRSLRNDGTYPGMPAGRLLIRRGSVGYVRDVGTFLQDQLIYSVDFIEQGITVGCREQELQLESDDWIPTRFEFRDKVTPAILLGIKNEVIARPGELGEIEKVYPEKTKLPLYQLRINGRSVVVPEDALTFYSDGEGSDG